MNARALLVAFVGVFGLVLFLSVAFAPSIGWAALLAVSGAGLMGAACLIASGFGAPEWRAIPPRYRCTACGGVDEQSWDCRNSCDVCGTRVCLHGTECTPAACDMCAGRVPWRAGQTCPPTCAHDTDIRGLCKTCGWCEVHENTDCDGHTPPDLDYPADE